MVPQLLEALETVGELVREGKVGHFGLSNETAWGTMQYLRLAQELDLPRIAAIQNEYNLLRRYHTRGDRRSSSRVVNPDLNLDT